MSHQRLAAGSFLFLQESFFFGNWDLNSGLLTCKAGSLPLEPVLQSILLWLFWRWGLENHLSRLTLNHDPSDLSLPSS
jgi:hypothetical protein